MNQPVQTSRCSQPRPEPGQDPAAARVHARRLDADQSLRAVASLGDPVRKACLSWCAIPPMP